MPNVLRGDETNAKAYASDMLIFRTECHLCLKGGSQGDDDDL